MASVRNSVSWRVYGVHVLRVCLFVAVLLLIHLQYKQLQAKQVPSNLEDIEIGFLQTFFPNAHEYSDTRSPSGGLPIQNESSDTIGYILQTSPESSHIVGFSGPTNVLLMFTPDGELKNLQILASADTPAHIEQVIEADHFFDAFIGYTEAELSKLPIVDGVSGATLTSIAIQESIMNRLGGVTESLKFPDPIQLEDAIRLFPNADHIWQDSSFPSGWYVYDKNQEQIGSVLRTSPSADSIIGYQGPTDTLIGFDIHQQVLGIRLGKTYDNEEYVEYILKDDYFQNLFNEYSLQSLGLLDLEQAEVEGTSGATMTSMAIARGMIIAAHNAHQHQLDATKKKHKWKSWSTRDIGTTIIILVAIIIGLTRLRGQKYLRIIFPLVLIVYVGFINGDMLSQAMIAGWARHGIPWNVSPGLILLSIAACILPITTRNNIYCHHLCPHGAAQQLLRKISNKRWSISPKLSTWLKKFPGVLLILCVLISMTSFSFSLVDLEPFDAWVFRIAGWATMTIAIVGLVASFFIPMAYCKYGCPTGALLNFLRLNANGDRWSKSDWYATALLIISLCIWQFG